jgi:hypothetical protein
MADNVTTNFTEESLKVGNTVYVSLGTDDEDLADYLEEHGDQITITEVELDGDELTGNFWGTSADGEDCPYHLEWRDVYAVDVDAVENLALKVFKNLSNKEVIEYTCTAINSLQSTGEPLDLSQTTTIKVVQSFIIDTLITNEIREGFRNAITGELE